MAYKSILAFVPSAAKTKAICWCAATLSHDHGAHLTALSVTPDFFIPYAFGSELPSQFLEAPDKIRRTEIADIEKICSEIARQSDVKMEWRDVHGTRSLIADTVIEHGLSSDLVVMPQATGEEWGPWSELPDRVILNVGRPVLIVPDSVRTQGPPRNILVAWSDSPQSARAVFDALPMLKRADNVDVVSVAASTIDVTEGALAVDQVAIALARHGVKVNATSQFGADATVGEGLLDLAHNRNSDALVMGCYGHSRFREALLGGVSRSILQNLTLPVLMSH